MNPLAQNVKAIRKSLGKTQLEFATLLGSNRGAVAQWELGNNKPGADAMIALCKISNKTKKQLETELLAPKAQNAALYELTHKDEDHNKGFPVYDAIATAGPMENVSQLSGQPLFYMQIPGYEDCTMGLYNYGHSMYPTIESGNLLALRMVHDKSVILLGEIYVVRTKDYFIVKRLQKSEIKGHILCTSDNFEKRSPEFKRFESFDVAIDKIIDLYLVKGIFKKTQS